MPLTDPQQFADRAARRRRRTIRLLLASNLAIGLLLAFLVYLVLTASRDSYARQARDVAEGMAAIAQASIASELDQVDAVMRATESELLRVMAAGRADDAVVQSVLQSNFKLLKGVEALRMADAVGNVRWGTALPAGAPTSVADREYFKVGARHTSGDTLVAGPLKSRVSGNWVIAFMRPLHVDGQFRALLYVSIGAEYFNKLFERYDLVDQDAITLRNNRLELIARRAPGSSIQGEVGSTAVSEILREAVAAQPAQGTFVAKVVLDGIERTNAYRKVDRWPFTVYAGIAHTRFFKPWAQQAWPVSLLAALAWGLVVAASVAIFRASTREWRAVQASSEQTRRTQALLRTAGDGIHIVDHTGHLVDMSDSFAEMLRSSRESLLGRHISSWDVNQDEARITAWLSTVKDGDKQTVDVQHRRDDGTVIDVELHLRVAEIGDQLFVFGAGRDVTEVRLLAREQEAMLESDLIGMAKVEDRQIKWRNRAMERIFGYAPGELEGQATRMLYPDEESWRRVGAELYPALRQGAQYRNQQRMRRKHGEIVWIDLSAAKLTETCTLLMAVDITAMKEAHDHMVHVAFHDPLTKLPNRLLLADRLEQALAVAGREGSQVAVCFMDLDGFKAVNDQLGHDAGDDLLVEVARRLRASIRPSDTAARLGGDEFVLVLRSIHDDEWRRVLERVVQALAEPVTLPDGTVATVGTTFGVALSNASADETPGGLLDRADHLMLAGKRAGKGGIHVG
jgi:diguanylate cyclase (GGDEF)-like protein/PAS domain S-box-containing protein